MIRISKDAFFCTLFHIRISKDRKKGVDLWQKLNFIENGFFKYNIPMHYFLPIKRTELIRHFIECWYGGSFRELSANILYIVYFLALSTSPHYYYRTRKKRVQLTTSNLICVWKSVCEYAFFRSSIEKIPHVRFQPVWMSQNETNRLYLYYVVQKECEVKMEINKQNTKHIV